MFGLFGDPFFGYGRFPSFGFNRNDLRMLNMLQDIFEDDSDEEEQEQKNKENDKKEEVKNNKKENIKKEEKKESKIEDKNVVDSKSYQKYSQCDGTSGTVKETTTRRIGDQWCTIEEETNKNGEKITREKWHNVSNDDVDKFKSKWEKHKGKFGFEHLSLKGPND